MIEKPNNSIVLGEIKSKGLNKTDKLAKVTYTRGIKPKWLNKIDKLAKVTYTGGRNPKGLNKIQNLFVLWIKHCLVC